MDTTQPKPTPSNGSLPDPSFTADQTPAPDFEAAPEPHIEIVLPDAKPYVTYGILALTVIVFLLQKLAEAIVGFDLPAYLLAKINEYILQWQLWRTLTPVLVHGSLMHIAFNMYALHAIGPSLESNYGHWRLLALYVLAGIAGSTLSFFLTANPSLGASSSIFGLIAAQIVFVYKNSKLFGNRTRSVLIQLGMIVLINLGFGMTPGIDNWAHLGGLVGGGVYAWVAGPVLKPEHAFDKIRLRDHTPAQQGGLMAAIEFVVLLAILILAILTSR